jgi:hypothetical protein
MPSFHDAFPSKWLKAADCVPDLTVKITSAGFEDVGTGSDVKRKLVLHFAETDQGLVLNVTNCNLIEAILGTDDYDDWIGHRITLVSVKVQFKDKLVDAIRVQPPPARTTRPLGTRPSRPQPPAPKTDPDDPIPAADTDVGF